jgi:hypothetical protein
MSKEIDYSEKLKHPLWQKKRLEIFNRDDFTCQICGDTETQLHVHHKKYFEGVYPWEYDNKQLITYCENCHQEVEEQKKTQHSAHLKKVKISYTEEDEKWYDDEDYDENKVLYTEKIFRRSLLGNKVTFRIEKCVVWVNITELYDESTSKSLKEDPLSKKLVKSFSDAINKSDIWMKVKDVGNRLPMGEWLTNSHLRLASIISDNWSYYKQDGCDEGFDYFW